MDSTMFCVFCGFCDLKVKVHLDQVVHEREISSSAPTATQNALWNNKKSSINTLQIDSLRLHLKENCANQVLMML